MTGAADRPAAVELRRVHLPLREPFRAAHGTETVRDVVIVSVTDRAGGTGWGECATLSAPTYSDEYTEGAWHHLVETAVPALLAGGRWRDDSAPMASAAIEMALLDIDLRAAGRSLADEIGGGRARVASGAVIGMSDDLDHTIESVAARVAEGCAQVKLKIRPGWDVVPLGAVRATWPDLALAADANGSYDESNAPFEALDELGLVYLEQPFAVDRVEALAGASGRWSTPIALDESLISCDAARRLVALDALHVLSIKPARVGGLRRAVDLVTLAVEHGREAFVGGMLETGIGRAAALAVAALPGCTLPADLGPSARYFAQDLTAPFALEDGCLVVPTGPGLGVEPDRDRLDEVTVELVVQTA